MSQALHYGLLSKALCKLETESGNRNVWDLITEESGVINVKAIAEGTIKPTMEAWQQLHNTFPDKIPAP